MILLWTLLKGLLLSLWSRFAGYVILAGSIAGAVLVVFFKGKSAGKASVKRAMQKKNDSASQRTAKIVNQVKKAGNDDIQKKLEKYYRD